MIFNIKIENENDLGQDILKELNYNIVKSEVPEYLTLLTINNSFFFGVFKVILSRSIESTK